MSYSNRGLGGGAEATQSTTAPDLTGPLAEEFGLCTPSRSWSIRPSVCLTDCLAASHLVYARSPSIPEDFVFHCADVRGCPLRCTQLCL